MDLGNYVVTLLILTFGGYVNGLKPVILIPGDGGNQLEVKVDNTWAGGDCPRPSGWKRLWLDVWQLGIPSKLKCWADKMELQYDPEHHTSYNKPGVETRVPKFGETDSMEYLDPSWTAYFIGNAGAYMSLLVKELKSWGYVKGKNLRGAPYDFRFAPHSQDVYFKDLKRLIESTYETNEQTKVVLITHSAGGLFATYFLNDQTQSWKNKYINSLVTLASPWDGSAMIFHAFTSGYNFNIKVVHPLVVRGQQRTTETNMLLLPKQPGFDQHQVFVVTNNKNYSLSNINEYFHDIGFTEGEQRLQDVKSPKYTLQHPGVKLHCWYGIGVDTPEMYIYDKGDFPDGQPSSILNKDGDGTVNIVSLDRCREWVNEVGVFTDVDVKTFDKISHNQLLFHKPMFNQLKNILKSN